MDTSETHRLNFKNSEGLNLAAKLEFPADGKPKAFALFAHCFTCGKNIGVIRHISRALTSHGFAVLVFDFTGLGQSEGDFSDTNFNSNIEDLVDAANFLRKNYEAPKVLIGHSLGGAAVLFAAKKIKEVQAVATIGAPFDPSHVLHLVGDKLKSIQENGATEVTIASRSFKIKSQFIEELEEAQSNRHIHTLGKALLVLHSPQDEVVSIDNARYIFKEARHPKSFISLNGADHLLTNLEDAVYAADTIATWSTRYVDFKKEKEIKTDQQVVAVTGKEGYLTQIRAGEHYLLADEPSDMGGKDLGTSPYGLLLSALGSCTSITLRMYADLKKWPLREVRVHLSHEKVHALDSENNKTIDHIVRKIELEGELTDDQKERLLQIADRCPIHKTLHNKIEVISSLI